MTAEPEGLASKFGHWVALYGAYLFVAGWSYQSYYFTAFGMTAGWLDLGLNDTIARGFAVLFGAGTLLSIIYVAILLLSLAVDVFRRPKSRLLDGCLAAALVLMFVPIFLVASHAGLNQGNADRGPQTTLPTIAFTAEKCAYLGKLVYLRADTVYVHDLVKVPQEAPPGVKVDCPITPTGDRSGVPVLWVLKLTDLKGVKIIHYARGVKP